MEKSARSSPFQSLSPKSLSESQGNVLKYLSYIADDVGELNRLHVTPDRFLITYYKTDDLASTTATLNTIGPRNLLMNLNFASMTPLCEARASLRFTDAGVEE